MNRNTRNIGLLLLLIQTTLFTSCYKKEFDSIEFTNYEPKVSLPLGTFEITVPQLIENRQMNPVDPNLVPAATPLVYYQGLYYETPYSFDTTIVKDFSIRDIQSDTELIEEMMIRANFINSSQAQIAFQLYFFEDGNTDPVDSLYHLGPLIVRPASIRSNGTLQIRKSYENDERFDHGRIQLLQRTSSVHLKLHFIFDQTGFPVVAYNTHRLLWLQLAIYTHLNLNPNEW